jgi:hypothetical protein
MIAWYAGLHILVVLEQMRRRIWVMQIRLAQMHDELNELRGRNAHHLVDQYSAGP